MKISVVVPTINSIEEVKRCIASLKRQSIPCDIVVVANGTTDGTQRYISNEEPDIHVLSYINPLGFAGAVNEGIRYSIENRYTHVALLNNDAVADRNWLKSLLATMDSDPGIGIVTGKIRHQGTSRLDSTGDFYTSWLLPYPRGRGEKDTGKYENVEEVPSASGGASLYRVEMLKSIGLFDKDFFAYYEDVDLSIRARHAGWKVYYTPEAIVDHAIGGTSKGIRGFTTYQTMKNLPLLYVKNVPLGLIIKYVHGFNLAYVMFGGRAVIRGHGWYAIKGFCMMIFLLPSKFRERRKILSRSTLSKKDFDQLLVHDLPPNAKALRKIRKKFGSKR